jgi:glycine/D-amino acid oxidase-like deaminating enzyme
VDEDLTSPAGEGYRHLSLWWDSLAGPIAVRPSLPGDIEVDVAVVGAGLTGLWTAYYLTEAEPTLRIAVIDRDVVGFGASGRNGGWCSALFAASGRRLDRVAGPGSGEAMRRAMEQTIDEVGRAAATERIDCSFAKGGTVVLARSPAQQARAAHEVDQARAGIGLDGVRLLSAEEASSMVGATSVLGGTFTPHCAVVDPARLVRGLAEVVEGRGVAVYERTTAHRVGPGAVRTDRGTIRATNVVRATEGYTRSLAGEERTLAPVYSLMIATEPLPDDLWAQIGLAERQTFSDFRHVVIYGQRTGDGRIAFGGRGAPYHFGSAVQPGFDRDRRVHQALHTTLVELFPVLADIAITHRWGGPLGIARDWFPSVGLDPRTGLAWAGGYVGDGLSTTNLAGRTLTDLILARSTDITTLPWVGHRSPRWEPEPLRYVGINAGLRLASAADRAEEKRGRTTWQGRALDRVTGG